MPWMNLDYYHSRPEAEQDRIFATHLPLGEHPKTGDAFFVPDADLYSGMHVIGVQGMGKSSFLENLIYHNIWQKKTAVIVLDRHGDLVNNCVASLPEDAIGRTSVMDMADEAYPFRASLFAQGDLDTEAARAQAKERVMHVFEVFWPEVMNQQYVPLYLSYAIPVMLDNPGATIVDLKRFLLNKTYRAQLLKRVREPSVRDFWEREYDTLKEETQKTRTRPLINRIHVLTASPLLRNIVAQSGAIDFRKAIEQREVLFFKLPTLGQDAGMVGTILMGQISAAIFSFGDVPPEKRPGVSLYVDEFQTFATPDFETLFSQGRKFGLRLTVANQRLDQLSAKLQAATLSARTKVIFRVTVDDAKKLAQVFPPQAKRPKPEDIQLQPCDYLLSHTHLLTDPGLLAFIEGYLLPLQGQRTSKGQVLITDAGFHAEEIFSSPSGLLNGIGVLSGVMGGGSTRRPTVYVPDPTPHLDMLFREVMATDNPRLPIPPEVVRGLSNCGGFFSAVRNISYNDPVLQAGFTPPPHLACETAQGWEWLRQPESPGEWLAQCVFFLRLAMEYLAAHPLGNVKETNTSEMAQKLAQLQKRIAFMRSGDEMGPIKTLDAPEPEGNTAARRDLITWQTRERYCRPREDVEAAFTPEPIAAAADMPDDLPDTTSRNKPEPEPPTDKLPDEPDISRWEF